MEKPHTAVVMLRPGRNYRREIFHAGLRKNGYRIADQPLSSPTSGDVLVLWNRFPMQESIARTYERNGATVLVAENGYIGCDDQGQQFFALAKSQHNGAGTWRVGGPERWETMHVDLSPWRTDGSFLLLLPQRGFGPAGVGMPIRWEQFIARKLPSITTRPFLARPHPGREKTEPYKALKGAWAAITWGSGAGIKALAAGYPVFHEMPNWIGAPASRFIGDVKSLEYPFMGDRLPMFQRLAWAQWSSSELESGVAFRWLLELE